MPKLTRDQRAALRGIAISAIHTALPDVPMAEIARALNLSLGAIRAHLMGVIKIPRLENRPTWEDAVKRLALHLSRNETDLAARAAQDLHERLRAEVQTKAAA